MASQILSQEEIDALLRGSGNITSESSDDVFLTDMERDTLGEIGNITMGTAATTLSTLLGKKVSITTPVVNVQSAEELIKQYQLPYVVIDVRYTKGLEGTNLLVIGKREATVIVDLMMGSDGLNPPDELDEFHLSGVAEAMNQMMGTAATSMANMFGKAIDISPPHAELVNLSSDQVREMLGIDKQKLVTVAFRMVVEGLIDSEIVQLIPFGFAKEMIKSLLGELPDEAASTTAPAPAAAPPPIAQQPPAPQAAVAETQSDAPASPLQEKAARPMPQSTSAEQPRAAAPTKPVNKPMVEVQPAQFMPLQQENAGQGIDNLGLIMDVPLQLTVELGRTRKLIKEILEFAPGSVIELDRLAGEPVDVLANGKLIAKGEVVVIDENFGIRITDIVSPLERMRNLQ